MLRDIAMETNRDMEELQHISHELLDSIVMSTLTNEARYDLCFKKYKSFCSNMFRIFIHYKWLCLIEVHGCMH